MKKKIIPKGPKPVVRCAYTEMVPLSKLKPHELNPNTHSPEQIEFFVGVLKYQGIRRPITVSKRSGFITRGHGLLEAIRKCGWSEAPCDFQDYESEAQELADIVADNELARLSMTDRKLLDALALKLPEGFDLKLLAIPRFELPKLPGEGGSAGSGGDPKTMKLSDRFLVPPFSVLDTRQGYWQDRKREWLALGIKSEIGRGGLC